MSSLRQSLLTALLITTSAAPAAEAPTHIHQIGKFRVRYHTEGKHAIAPADHNQNDIPDQAEDILTQVMAAHLLFVEALGFPDPLQTERFRSATVLDISIRSKEEIKSNGVAFDELQRSKDGDWIGVRVASTVHATANLTPAHELFHLIQYGTSYFKNSWFAEGTARWSERALGTGALGPAQKPFVWPLSPAQAEGVFSASYDAATQFWNPLAARLDPAGVIPDSPALQRLQAMRYADGSPVLKDLKLTGWAFIRDVIIELGKAGDTAFRELGYDRWSEANQFSKQNNAYILTAVEQVVRRHENTAPPQTGRDAGDQHPYGS